MSAGVPQPLQRDSLDRAFPRRPCFPSDPRGAIALSLIKNPLERSAEQCVTGQGDACAQESANGVRNTRYIFFVLGWPQQAKIQTTVMRIAQIAPLAESVPPKLYGGTERVVAWLVGELVELGHEGTLFASGDSKTRGELCAVWPRALRLGRPHPDPNAVCAMSMEAVAGRAR